MMTAKAGPWTSAGTATTTCGDLSTDSRLPGVDRTRIGVMGLSMGREEAIGAAATDPRSPLSWPRERPAARLPTSAGCPTSTEAGSAHRSLAGRTDVRCHRPVDRGGAARLLARRGARGSPRPVLLVTAGNVPDEASAAASGRVTPHGEQVDGTGCGTHPGALDPASHLGASRRRLPGPSAADPTVDVTWAGRPLWTGPFPATDAGTEWLPARSIPLG